MLGDKELVRLPASRFLTPDKLSAEILFAENLVAQQSAAGLLNVIEGDEYHAAIRQQNSRQS